jgi:hypothetical protein
MVPLSYSGTGLGPYGTGGIKVFVDICFITMFDRRLINKVATIAINIMTPGVRSSKIVKPLLIRTSMMIAARYEGWHITRVTADLKFVLAKVVGSGIKFCETKSTGRRDRVFVFFAIRSWRIRYF